VPSAPNQPVETIFQSSIIMKSGRDARAPRSASVAKSHTFRFLDVGVIVCHPKVKTRDTSKGFVRSEAISKQLSALSKTAGLAC
jgi:hypothetical protein